MRYFRLLVSMVICFVGSTRLSLGEGVTSGPTDEKPVRKLAVFLDAPVDIGSSAAWVLLLKEGKCIAKTKTIFERPVLFSDVVSGKVAVLVVPVFGNRDVGLYAHKEVEIKESGTTIAKLKPDIIRSVLLKVKVLNLDGKPLSGTRVSIKDITNAGVDIRVRAKTDASGYLTFKGFPDRKYQLRLRKALPQVTDFRSAILTVKDAAREVTWQLKRGPVVKIRFFVESDGNKHLFTNIKSINVGTDKSGCNYGVKDGEISLGKGFGLLQGAKQIHLTLTGGPDVRGYEIVRNAVIDINDEKEQIVDVVLALRRKAKVTVQCPDLSTLLPGRKILPRVYVIDKKNGRLVRGGRVGQPITLRFGQYIVAVWQPGYRLVKKGLTISNRKDVLLKVSLEKAPILKGRVLGKDGKPLAVAGVRVVYPDNEYLRTRTAPIKKDGTFALPIDDKLTAALAVLTKEHGGRIVKITKDNFSKVNEIRLAAPCAISGKITVNPDVKIEIKKLKWHIMWVSKDFPKTVISGSQVQDGTHKGLLQPGTYISYLFRYGDGVPLGKEVTITEKDKQKIIEPIVVTGELWAKKKSMHLLGVR